MVCICKPPITTTCRVKTMPNRFLLSVLIALFALSACQSVDQAPPSNLGIDSDYARPIKRVAGVEFTQEDAVTFVKTLAPLSKVRREGTHSLAEIDAMAHSILEEYSGDHPTITLRLKQQAAIYLLESSLESDDESLDPEALGFYVDLINETGNANVDLVAPALQKLKGHWTDQRIKDAAIEAAHNATLWLDRGGLGKNGVGVDHPGDDITSESIRTSMYVRREVIKSAVLELEAMFQLCVCSDTLLQVQ